MSLASWHLPADNGGMTITFNPPANAAHTVTDRRNDYGSPPATATSTLRRRLARRVRNAIRDHQPMITLSEQALSDIRNVHSVHR